MERPIGIILYYLFIAVMLTSCKADIRVQKYFRYTGSGVISGTIIHQLTTKSGLKCASTCTLIDATCNVSRYHEATKTCELLSSDPSGPVKWTHSPDWKIYTSQPISCGENWYEYGSSCYRVITLGTSSWQTASGSCTAMDAHLAVITDAAENTFLVDLLTSLNMSTEIFWIGANDMAVEGTYVWETEEPFNFTAHSPGSMSSTTYNCVCMIPTDGWYDITCANSYSHVCERNSVII